MPKTKPATTPKLKKGEIYAGISIADGKPVHLVLLPGDTSLPWEKAVAWAKKQGGDLPNRHDMLTLFENDKTRAKLEATWYWTSQANTRNTDYAWGQGFGYGSQDDDHKGDDYRCRAVRRVTI
jgi:hypothetical protein